MGILSNTNMRVACKRLFQKLIFRMSIGSETFGWTASQVHTNVVVRLLKTIFQVVLQ